MAIESERYGTRPHVKDASGRDTTVLVTITVADRRPPHGTKVFQGALHLEEGFKVKTGRAKCPKCRGTLDFRIVLERVD